MEIVLYKISYILFTLFEFYIISKFMNMFLGEARKEKRFIIAAYLFRFAACTIQYAYMPYALLNMFVGVMTLFFITLCYGGRIVDKMVTVVLMFICLFVSEAVVAGVLIIANVRLTEGKHNGDAFSYIGMTVVLWIIYIIISNFKNVNTKILRPKSFDIIIIALSVIIFSLETAIFSQESIADSIKILSVISVLMVLFLIIYLYDAISKNYMEKMHTEIIEREKAYYFNQAELLQRGGEEIRDFRHDMNNHLYAISAMVSDENEDAKKYIENLTKKIEKTKMYSNTGNIALDSVINYKLSKAEEQSIQIFSKIAIPSVIQSGEEDLVSIIGNLLDNAIEASEKLLENKYIDLNIKYKRGTLFIDVKNGYDGIVNQKEGQFITKKDDKEFHGIGLKSIDAAVNNNEGTMNIDFDNNEFRVSIMLYI